MELLSVLLAFVAIVGLVTIGIAIGVWAVWNIAMSWSGLQRKPHNSKTTTSRSASRVSHAPAQAPDAIKSGWSLKGICTSMFASKAAPSASSKPSEKLDKHLRA